MLLSNFISNTSGARSKAYLFVALSAIALSANAGEKVDKTIDADADSLVQIEHTAGKARIIAWDKAQVRVEGELGDDTEEFVFERSGKSIEITIEVEHGSSWGGWNSGDIDGDDITIYVPTNSRVEYDAVNADVLVEDVKGGANIEVVNGDINATGLAGKVELQTVNGGIEGKNIAGDLRVDTVNGDVEISHTQGNTLKAGAVNGDITMSTMARDIDVETVNGDIEFSMQQVDSLTAQTVNGRIDLDLEPVSGATIDINSVGGRINLALPADLEAKFDIEAHAGGRINNNFSDDKPSRAEYGPRRWLEFSSGAPKSTIDITTVHGTISLTKK